MKKVCSLKKKLVTFGLAVCTFVTSTGVNMCEAADKKKDEKAKSSWTVKGAVKGTVEWSLIIAFLVLAYKTGFASLLFKTLIGEEASTFAKIVAGIGGSAVLGVSSAVCKGAGNLSERAMEGIEEILKAIYNSRIVTALGYITYIPRKIVVGGYDLLCWIENGGCWTERTAN